MPRKNADVEEVETVETPAEGTKEAKAKKEPKRGDLPEGYVTPVQLAKELSERKLHQNRDGETVDVKPQMVYSYIKNASKDDPFPIETVKDSIGADRQALKLEAGLEWWARKNERVAARKANAAEKAKKAEENKAKKAAAAEAENSETEVTEAE
jgi:hypothetical protein